jgi:hypothetical protein
VSYRDDLDAAQARISALEDELGDARERVAELEGKRGMALAKIDKGALVTAEGQSAAQRWLGSPTKLSGERELEFAIDDETFSRVAEHLRRFYGNPGHVSGVAGTYSWWSGAASNGVGPFVTIYMTAKNGRTEIRGEQRMANMAGAIFGGVGGGVGGGGIGLPIAGLLLSPMLGIAAIPLWLGGTYWACRKLFRRSVEKAARRLDEALDLVVEVAAEARARAKSESSG